MQVESASLSSNKASSAQSPRAGRHSWQWSKALLGLCLCLLFTLSLGTGMALADNKDTTYLVFKNTTSWCLKGRALLRHPSLNSNYIMDYNSYIQGWNGSCSALKTFNAGSARVQGSLYGPGNVLCRSFGWVTNGSATNTFGVGAPANAYCGQGNYYVTGRQYFSQDGTTGSGSFTTNAHSF